MLLHIAQNHFIHVEQACLLLPTHEMNCACFWFGIYTTSKLMQKFQFLTPVRPQPQNTLIVCKHETSTFRWSFLNQFSIMSNSFALFTTLIYSTLLSTEEVLIAFWAFTWAHGWCCYWTGVEQQIVLLLPLLSSSFFFSLFSLLKKMHTHKWLFFSVSFSLSCSHTHTHATTHIHTQKDSGCQLNISLLTL